MFSDLVIHSGKCYSCPTTAGLLCVGVELAGNVRRLTDRPVLLFCSYGVWASGTAVWTQAEERLFLCECTRATDSARSCGRVAWTHVAADQWAQQHHPHLSLHDKVSWQSSLRCSWTGENLHVNHQLTELGIPPSSCIFRMKYFGNLYPLTPPASVPTYPIPQGPSHRACKRTHVMAAHSHIGLLFHNNLCIQGCSSYHHGSHASSTL